MEITIDTKKQDYSLFKGVGSFQQDHTYRLPNIIAVGLFRLDFPGVTEADLLEGRWPELVMMCF